MSNDMTPKQYNVRGQLKWDVNGFIDALREHSIEHSFRMKHSDVRESVSFELTFRDHDKDLERVGNLLEQYFKSS